MSIYKEIV